jgi:hypothetical protein
LILCRRESPGSGLNLARIALSESSQKVTDQHDQKDCAKPNASASARAPPVVAVVPSAAAEYQQQNNNQNDQHFVFPFAPDLSGYDSLPIAPSVSGSTIHQWACPLNHAH